MKANKFFLGLALVGAILTGCEKDPQTQTGEYDSKSYMSVSIAQAGGTRAGYEDSEQPFLQGTPDENKITTVDFYFYKADGTAFNFGSDAKNGANQSFNNSNVYTYAPGSAITDQNDNIDEIVDATLVIQHNTGNIPAYMIAVVNCTAGTYAGQPLATVKDSVINAADYVNSNGHIMTNSVYVGADGKIVMETPITVDNLAINADDAEKNPVKIYVERTAARIEVKEATTTAVYDTNTDITDAMNTTTHVYAKIIGWDVVTYANTTTLAKEIDLSWDATINGLTWNQPALYRSYWAKATPALTKTFSWNSLKNTVGAVDYCLENTTLPVYATQTTDAGETVEDKDVSRTNVTKVVVAAQLFSDQAGTKEVQIANWYGQYYTFDGLKAVVAQSLKNDLILKVGEAYTPITPAQITVVPNKDDVQNSYEVYFKLVDGIEGTWYAIDADNKYVAVEDANAVLANVENAKIWNGKSYYIVNIEHLGAKERVGETTEYAPAFYGVVRNHAYEITFSGVQGLGTPVYNPETVYPEPVTPENTESYVAAEINVLAWHLVKQTVTLQ